MHIRLSNSEFWQELEKSLRTRPATGIGIHMPRTINGENHRISMRIPKVMITEADRIVREHPELHYNRQQFIESAIREKIEKTRIIR